DRGEPVAAVGELAYVPVEEIVAAAHAAVGAGDAQVGVRVAGAADVDVARLAAHGVERQRGEGRDLPGAHAVGDAVVHVIEGELAGRVEVAVDPLDAVAPVGVLGDVGVDDAAVGREGLAGRLGPGEA